MGRAGVVPSVGAGLSLAVAGVVALVVASSFVALRGWPGVRPADRSTDIGLAGARPPGPEEELIVLGSAPARVDPSGGQGGTRSRRVTRGGRDAAPRTVEGRAGEPSAPAPASLAEPAGPPEDGSPSWRPVPGEPVARPQVGAPDAPPVVIEQVDPVREAVLDIVESAPAAELPGVKPLPETVAEARDVVEEAVVPVRETVDRLVKP